MYNLKMAIVKRRNMWFYPMQKYNIYLYHSNKVILDKYVLSNLVNL
jgi:hypothetical protein